MIKSMEQGPSWEAKCPLVSHEIPNIYETLKFITALTIARHVIRNLVKCFVIWYAFAVRSC